MGHTRDVCRCTCPETMGPICNGECHDQPKPCPPEPCELCTGNSACRGADGRLMTSWEWCQEVNTCAATIDWEKVAGR